MEVSLQVTDDRTPVNRQIVFSVIDHYSSQFSILKEESKELQKTSLHGSEKFSDNSVPERIEFVSVMSSEGE